MTVEKASAVEFKKDQCSQVVTEVIIALWRLRQEDHCKFKKVCMWMGILGSTGRLEIDTTA